MASEEHCIDVSEFDIKKFSVKPITPEMVTKQKDYNLFSSFTSYKYGEKQERFVFRTGEIKLTEGGIPGYMLPGSTKKSFYTDENDLKRAVIKIPLDPNQESSMEVNKMLAAVDKYAIANKDTLLAGIPQKIKKAIKYIEIARPIKTEEDDDGNPIESKWNKYGRAHIKLMCDFASGNIQTNLAVRTKAGELKRIKNATKIEDFEKYIRWNSTIKFIGTIDKLWVSKSALNKIYNYSYTIKCTSIIVTEQSESSVNLVNNKFFGFGDEHIITDPDDDDDEEEEKQSAKNKKSSIVKKTKVDMESKNKKKPIKDDIEDDNDEEASEEETDDKDEVDTKEKVAVIDKKEESDDDSVDDDDNDEVDEIVEKKSNIQVARRKVAVKKVVDEDSDLSEDASDHISDEDLETKVEPVKKSIAPQKGKGKGKK